MSAKPERDTPGIILATIFILVAGLFLNESRNMDDPDSFVFPVAICVILIGLSIAFIVWNIVRPHSDEEATQVPGSTVRRAGLVVGMLASAFTMPYIGFLPAGVGVFAALMALAMFDRWTWSRAITYLLVCIAIVFGFYGLFAKVFLVPLPEMPFF